MTEKGSMNELLTSLEHGLRLTEGSLTLEEIATRLETARAILADVPGDHLALRQFGLAALRIVNAWLKRELALVHARAQGEPPPALH